MADKQKDVNLVIKAQDQSKATLQGVADSVEAIAKALNKQVQAAKDGIVKSGELKDTLTQLQRAQAELTRQQGLIQFYQQLGERLDAAKQKAAAAGDAFAAGASKLDLVGPPTARQAAALDKLATAQTRANTAVDQALARLKAQAGRLEAAGISVTDLNGAMQRIVATAEQTGKAISTTDNAVINYNRNLRETREAAEQAAAAERQLAEATAAAQAAANESAAFRGQLDAADRKRQEIEYSAVWHQLLNEREAAEKRAAAETVEAEKEAAAAYEKAWAQAHEEDTFRTQLVVAERKRVENDYTSWWREELDKREAAKKEALEQRKAAEKAAAEAQKAALDAATAAQKRHDEAIKALNQTLGKHNEGERESLSWYQRVRGEVIALTTSYVGFMGVLGLAKGAIDAFVQKQAAENRLAIVVGNDPAAIGKEWSYVHDQATRLGIGIKELADSYSSFAIAAKNGNLTLDQTKFAFERITEVMRVNHASSEAIAGSFVQLEQMLSKNKVQMDDLRQASTWIPGLEGMMARGLGMANVEQLFEQMKKGAVDAKSAVLALAEEMRREYAERLPDALKSLQAEQGRFSTAYNDFQRMIAAGTDGKPGFAAAYTELLQKLTMFFRSDDGKKFAQDLSDAFSSVVKSLGGLDGLASSISKIIGALAGMLELINKISLNGRLLGDAFELALGVKIFNSMKNMIVGLETVVRRSEDARLKALELAQAQEQAALAGNAMATAEHAVAAGATAATTAVGFLGRALGFVVRIFNVIGWVLLALDIAKMIYDKVPGVQKAVAYMGEGISSGFKIAILEIEMFWDRFVAKIGSGMRSLVRGISRIGLMQPETPAETQQKGLKELDDQAAAEKQYQDDPAKVAEIQRLRDAWSKRNAEIAAGKKDDPANPELTAGQQDALDYVVKKQRELNGILDERQKLLDAIREKQKAQLITQKQAEEQTTKTFASFGPRLKQFQKEAVGGAQIFGTNMPLDKWQELASRMSAAAGVYEPNLSQNNDKLLKQQETLAESLARQWANLNASLEKNDKDTNKTYAELLAERVDATHAAYAKIEQDIAKFQKIGGGTVTLSDGTSISTSRMKEQLADMQKQAELQATQQLQTQQLAKDEQAVTDAIKERTDRVKTVVDQVADGSINAAEGFKRIKEISEELTPKIRALAQQAKDFANSIKGSGGVSDEKLGAFIAKQDLTLQQNSDKPGTNTEAGKAGLQAYAAEQKQLNDIIAERNELVQTYDSLVKLGSISQGEADDKIKQAFTETRPQIDLMVAQLQAQLEAMHKAGDITDITYEKLNAQLGLVKVQASDVRSSLEKTFDSGFASGLTKAFDSLGETISGLIDNTKSWGDAWHDLGNITRVFFADLLKQIANALIQQEALLIASRVSGFFGLGASAAGASAASSTAASSAELIEAHSGAIIGHSGGASRRGSASWFANAPRYHDGAIVGLRADEQAAILQKGEEVLTRDDPRNALNGGRTAGGSQPAQAPNQRIVNVLHPDLFHDYMNSSAGEEVHLNVIRRNGSAIKQILSEA